LFIGEVTAVNIKRGRNLYTVLYEDGAGEDMNDRDHKAEKTQGKNRSDKSDSTGSDTALSTSC
jgi:hypothetical protein